MGFSPFLDEEAAERARERLLRQFGRDVAGLVAEHAERVANPDLALANMERWLQAVSNSVTLFDFLAQTPHVASVLVQMLGSSRSLSDILVQNPELAAIIVDVGTLVQSPKSDKVLAEARELVAHAISDSHALDRLRFLKQRWTLSIAVNDLTGNWTQQAVWRAISDLAGGLIAAAREVTWKRYCEAKGLDGPCPLHIFGMGKLGGHELNYSSDVDLVYVVEDDLPETLEGHVTRFAEAFGRALADRMSRGMLYRVDLRLRPYGASGPIINRMRAIESYYASYAEPWEHLALIRSRMVCGSAELSQRWEDMRISTSFLPARSEWMVEEWLRQRERTEAQAPPDDLKRGRGGIRDVEFLVQTLQALCAHRKPTLQVRSTLDALDALAEAEILSLEDSKALAEDYTWLRQVEHRIQLVSENQTHSLPSEPIELRMLARSMGMTADAFLPDLEHRRNRVREIYDRVLSISHGGEVRREIMHRLGEASEPVLQWLDAMPDSDAFLRAVEENESSLARLKRVAKLAPLLLPELTQSPELTEAVISGEIEERVEPMASIAGDEDIEPKELAMAFQRDRTRLIVQYVLDAPMALGESLSRLTEAAILRLAAAAGLLADIVALGSLAAREVTVGSDADLLFLVPDEREQEHAERAAQSLVDLASEFKRYGTDLAIDLRLRPDGRKGLLVRSYMAFATYGSTSMEAWERFALSRYRVLRGDGAGPAIEQVLRLQPWTEETLGELLAMKHRIETERVSPHLIRRNIKLGEGGLSDIEWLCQLLVLAHLGAGPLPPADTDSRLHYLAQEGLLNALEADTIGEASRHLLSMRHRLILLGAEPDILPENPERLEQLAESMKFADAYDLMRRHEELRSAVRMIFDESMMRLRA